MIDLNKQIDDLFSDQLMTWTLARSNYGQLHNLKVRELNFDGFKVILQFNPGRIRSSSASVDQKSVDARPCFLCKVNRPEEQKFVTTIGGLSILVNPFPIFWKHLTIVSEIHTDQRIFSRFSDLLGLAKLLPGFVIFYNGPECGASAPDHFHFQAGNRESMPLEQDFKNGRYVTHIRSYDKADVFIWKNYLRGIITITGTSEERIDEIFNSIYNKMSAKQPDRPEPMINCLAYFANNEWVIHIIPRKVHRPSQYFESENKRFVVSPASVDLAGLIIAPREEDFNNLNTSLVKDIFRQVCYTDNEIEELF